MKDDLFELMVVVPKAGDWLRYLQGHPLELVSMAHLMGVDRCLVRETPPVSAVVETTLRRLGLVTENARATLYYFPITLGEAAELGEDALFATRLFIGRLEEAGG